MTRANKLICPSCSTPLKSARGIRIGKKITCPKCQIGFTVRPEDAEQAELAAGTNLSRLAIVLAGALLYLMIGSWLAGYCFQHNDSRADVAKVEPGKSDGDGGTSVPAKAPATPKPGRVSPADQRKIDNAIANGVWFLKGHLRPDGALGDSGWESLAGRRRWLHWPARRRGR
jgi:hypothetical protein